jgi:hypothetical protein
VRRQRKWTPGAVATGDGAPLGELLLEARQAQRLPCHPKGGDRLTRDDRGRSQLTDTQEQVVIRRVRQALVEEPDFVERAPREEGRRARDETLRQQKPIAIAPEK